MNKKKRRRTKEESATEELAKKSMYPNSKLLDESEEIKGKNVVYPTENFIKLQVSQYKNKINLTTYKYESKQANLQGVVILMLFIINQRHGLYEYSNRNAYIAKLMAEKGFEVVAFDLRGHGKSEGIRGYFQLNNLDFLKTSMFW
jgi:hypothetical protein